LSADETPPGSSPVVSARDVLNALSEIRRRGQWPLFQELESIEPELAEFVLEEITAIHHTLLKTGARPKAVRRFQRQVQSLVLVCVLSQRPRPADDSTPASRVPRCP
jgi:hypothetical protein